MIIVTSQPFLCTDLAYLPNPVFIRFSAHSSMNESCHQPLKSVLICFQLNDLRLNNPLYFFVIEDAF